MSEALYQLYNLRCRLDVKLEIDSGSIEADSADSGGTAVTFNKAFKDVDSVTATASETTSEITVVVDFVDIPNPTGFNVLAFDSSGSRVTTLVSWKARGVL